MGKIELPGSVSFDAATKQYRVTGSGANMWGSVDAFHFVWKKVDGDLELSAEVNWEGAGKNAHRKAGWMVRQDLSADAPYADAVVHGDGLISLQYRRERSGPTLEVKTPFKPPASIKLERHADVFTLSVAARGESFRPAASVTVSLSGEVYAGLVVCSHDAAVSETAIFRDVQFKHEPIAPGQPRVRESTLETIAIDSGLRTIVYRAKEHFEAPNWSRDGRSLFFNRGGRIYTLPVAGGTAVALDTGKADRCNNDHGLSPDGRLLAISHTDRGCGSRSSRSCRVQAGRPSGSRRWGRRTGMAGRPTGRRWLTAPHEKVSSTSTRLPSRAAQRRGSRLPAGWMTAPIIRPTASTFISTPNEPVR